MLDNWPRAVRGVPATVPLLILARNDSMKLKQTEEQFVRRGRGVWERQKVYDYLANRHGDTPVAFSEIYGLFPWNPYDSINHVCESTVKNWFKALGVEVAK